MQMLHFVGHGQLNHRQIVTGGSSNLHERARVRGERKGCTPVGRLGRSEGKKDGIAEAGENGDERTGRNKTVISRHFTHERERLADSTCVPAFRCRFPAAVKRPSSLFPLSSRWPSHPFLTRSSGALFTLFSLALSPTPSPSLAEKYCSR